MVLVTLLFQVGAMLPFKALMPLMVRYKEWVRPFVKMVSKAMIVYQRPTFRSCFAVAGDHSGSPTWRAFCFAYSLMPQGIAAAAR